MKLWEEESPRSRRAEYKHKNIRVQLRDRDLVTNQILDCRNCELSALSLSGPVPYKGSSTSRVVVVGEAPGAIEDQKGEPFSGPAGELIHNEFRLHNVLPERLMWMNVVSCMPQPKTTPHKKHVDYCSRNCWDQLNLSSAKWVLVVGGVALHALFPWDLAGIEPRKITAMHGLPWDFRGKHWMACIHPAAGLRQEKYLTLFRSDINRFVNMVKTGPDWSERCIVCDEEVERYSAQGLAYCGKH